MKEVKDTSVKDRIASKKRLVLQCWAYLVTVFDAIIYVMDDFIIKKLSKDLNFTFLPFSDVVKTFKVKF